MATGAGAGSISRGGRDDDALGVREKRPAESPSKCRCQSGTIAKWAAAFFILSGIAVGVMYGLDTTDFVYIPFATGGLSFVVMLISGTVALCKQKGSSPVAQAPLQVKDMNVRQFWATSPAHKIDPQIFRGKATEDTPVVVTNRYNPNFDETVAKEDHTQILQASVPHSEALNFVFDESFWLFGVNYDNIVDYFNKNPTANPELLINHALYAICVEQGKTTARGDALLRTNRRPLYVIQPLNQRGQTPPPAGVFCDLCVPTSGDTQITARRGLIAKYLMQLRSQLLASS